MLIFSANLSLGMLINVMLIKKRVYAYSILTSKNVVFFHKFEPSRSYYNFIKYVRSVTIYS